MAINPLTPVPPGPGLGPVLPVSQASAVRAVVGRLAAIVQTLGPTRSDAPVAIQSALARAVSEAVQAAAPRQNGLAPLMADLSTALASPSTPAPARAAAAELLAMRTPTEPAPNAAQLKAAVARSGLFLEARLAAMPSGAPVPPDLKAALLVARQAFSDWARATAAEPLGPPAPTATPAGPAPTRPTASPPPAPPLRSGPLSGQPPVEAAAQVEPRELAPRLVRETEAALARQELLQAASLPGARAADPAEPPGRAHWLFEIPLAAPQGAAVAPFEVERDGGGADAGPGALPPAWRARFALDIEPLGPLQIQVTLSGDRAGVQMWAERTAAAEQLRSRQGVLRAELQAADYAADVVVATGAPAKPATPTGLLVDQSS